MDYQEEDNCFRNIKVLDESRLCWEKLGFLTDEMIDAGFKALVCSRKKFVETRHCENCCTGDTEGEGFILFADGRKKFIPLFTDLNQAVLWYTCSYEHISIVEFKLLDVFEMVPKAPYYDGVIINPGSFKWKIGLAEIELYLTHLHIRMS